MKLFCLTILLAVPIALSGFCLGEAFAEHMAEQWQIPEEELGACDSQSTDFSSQNQSQYLIQNILTPSESSAGRPDITPSISTLSKQTNIVREAKYFSPEEESFGWHPAQESDRQLDSGLQVQQSAALVEITENLIFPATGDLQTSDNYWSEGTYIKGDRQPSKVKSILRLDWEITAESNTLNGDVQEHALYLNGALIGNFALKEGDLQRKFSFSFAPKDVSKGLSLKVLTTRTVKDNCGSFKFAFDASKVTVYEKYDSENPDAIATRKIIFPELPDFLSSFEYGKEGTYYEGKREGMDIGTISSLAWDIIIVGNTLANDNQDQALYINGVLVGNFSFMPSDNFIKRVSFKFRPISVSNELTIRLVTTRSTKSGMVQIALNQCLITFISDGALPTTSVEGLRLRTDSEEVSVGEEFGIDVAFQPDLTGPLSLGQLADAYLTITPADESWTMYMYFDSTGQMHLSGDPMPLVKNWAIIPFEYMRLTQVSVPSDSKLVGTYNITAYIVPAGGSIENTNGSTINIGVNPSDLTLVK